MSPFVLLHAKATLTLLALAADPPPSVTLVTKDATPAAPMSWWVLPLVLGLAGVVVGVFWWWWRNADALERDPATWATRQLLAAQPRPRRSALKAAAKRLDIPLLALLMSEHAAQRALGEPSPGATP
ncbi:MAG: hypothetical protein GC200_11790 [Tepidisphaera sp.]|nr:hypothetical protein [Tepidisphaera sp.]